MVTRVYSEKKEGFRQEAAALMKDIRESLSISLSSLRIVNAYDVEGIGGDLLERARKEVFSEPPVDDLLEELPPAEHAFRVSYLPGQFDQRARSAEECISFLSPGTAARVKSSRVYLADGCSAWELERIKRMLINPVEAMEDGLAVPETLSLAYDEPGDIAVIDGFRKLDEEGLRRFIADYGLAMDADDLEVLRKYFDEEEERGPTITEIRVCDTYWSDHCRHTTFLTELDEVDISDGEIRRAYMDYLALREETGRSGRPQTLMDIATIGAKALKKRGLLPDLDESEEINACSIRRTCLVDGREVPYLLLFKNETHNHPTEIEPFGGAATCIGGAIRDPLSGRAYVYQAMRITGSGDVTEPFSSTIPGKLPQRKIGLESAHGYSSYGNQIGLATGLVDEIYHPGYKAKHMELGAVLGAVPESHVRREAPLPGDVVLLLGGRTGRDGIGGATGSSKSHVRKSLETCSAEVQKGNAPEERKLQRLFMDREASLMIKRCNDFGAGGVSVAIGELADGLSIDLDAVPKKYMGLDGTELAISESQERMAVVVAAEDRERFVSLAAKENLECTEVAVVSEEPVLRMFWRGKEIVHLKRSFLNTNGSRKHARAAIAEPGKYEDLSGLSLEEALGSLELSSRQGLAERFDSTIGASSVLVPFGGRYQKTPAEAMCALLPSASGRTGTASLFAYGFNPHKSDMDPYHGSYDAVVDSIAKIIAAGGRRRGCYLTLQEFFGRTGTDPRRWGRPLAALLGALEAQIDLEAAAIGGKDSMSGTFEDIDVPNTLVSFAVNTIDPVDVISPEFRKAGSYVYIRRPHGDMKGYLDSSAELFAKPCVLAVSTVPYGNAEAAIAKMCFGNMIGFSGNGIYASCPSGTFIFESDEELPGEELLGRTTEEKVCLGRTLESLLAIYEGRLADAYPIAAAGKGTAEAFSYGRRSDASPAVRCARPHVLIPVFPGTNCEIDTAKAFADAGADVELQVICNLSADSLERSIGAFAAGLGRSQVMFIPGGFSGADEPDGSGKFITAFMRNPMVREGIEDLLDRRGGLVGGICNGFQALIKLGLLPYGRFVEPSADSPTLTFNTIGRHISHVAATRVASVMSPWMREFRPGEVVLVPISHGEGRFIADEGTIAELAANGQIATQYCSLDGIPSLSGDVDFNGSAAAIEGITSPDGRVFGRMGHIERCQRHTLLNAGGKEESIRFFRSAVSYFR